MRALLSGTFEGSEISVFLPRIFSETEPMIVISEFSLDLDCIRKFLQGADDCL
jgi:hypothetical protein